MYKKLGIAILGMFICVAVYAATDLVTRRLDQAKNMYAQWERTHVAQEKKDLLSLISYVEANGNEEQKSEAAHIRNKVEGRVLRDIEIVAGQDEPTDIFEETQTRVLIPSKYSQTEALLTLPSVKNEISKQYKFTLSPETPSTSDAIVLQKSKGGPDDKTLANYQNLLNRTLAKERENKDSHFVFYHALAKQWILAQDIYFRLFVSLRPLNTRIKDFRFLRWGSGSELTNVNDFLMKSMQSVGLVNDNKADGRASLLSTNLALFGNVGFPGECTFEYFIKPVSHTQLSPAIFNSMFEQFNIPATIYEKYISRLQEIGSKYLYPELAAGQKPKEQALLQIFVPKSLIDEVGYLAWVRGVPREESLVAWVENSAKTSLGHPPAFAKSGLVLDYIEMQFQSLKESDPLYQEILSGILTGKYRLSVILGKYTNTPEQVPNIVSLQARLLLNAKLLNPDKDIRMYTYDFISNNSRKKYNKELAMVIAELVGEFLKENVKNSL